MVVYVVLEQGWFLCPATDAMITSPDIVRVFSARSLAEAFVLNNDGDFVIEEHEIDG